MNPEIKPTAPTTSTVDKNYFMQPNESVDAYKVRVQNYNTAKEQNPAPTTLAEDQATAAKNQGAAPPNPAVTPAGGTYTGQDGKTYYNANNQPVTATTTSAPSTSTPSAGGGPVGGVDATGKPLLASQPERSALQDTQARYQETAQRVQDTITNIQNGVIPLSAGDNAQIAGLQQQFQTLIDAQKLTNTGATGMAQMRGAQKGALEYDPHFQMNTIQTIVSAGAAKVADLQIKEASAVASMTQAFKDNNIKAVQDAWSVYKDASKERQDALAATIEDASAAIKDAAAAQQKELEAQAKKDEALQEEKNLILQKMGESGKMVSPEVYAAVKNAQTATDAYVSAGDLLYSANDVLDAQYKKASIDKIYADMRNDAAAAAGGGDPMQIIAYANEYAATGKIPSGMPKGSFGTIAQVAKELPKSPGQILSVSTGVSPTGDTTLQQGLGALYSATVLSKQLKELDQQRWDGIAAGVVSAVHPTQSQQTYLDLREQIVDLLSRARSGAALTVSEEKRYKDMLPGRFAQPLGLGPDTELRITNFTNTLESDMKNKASVQGWAINGVSEVDVAGQKYKVGDVVQNSTGQSVRINPDGTGTLVK